MPAPSSHAARLIDDLRRAHESWKDNAKHVAMLSADAAGKTLADVLAQPEIAAKIAQYDKNSREAGRHQTRHKRAALWSVSCGSLAAIVAGVMLYFSVGPTAGTLGIGLASLYFVLILIALTSSVYIAVGKPWTKWKTARNAAETQRIGYFHEIFNAPDPTGDPAGAPSRAALKLEFVRAFLMEDQQNWYARRAEDFQADVARATWQRVIALVLVAAASVPVLISLLSVPLVSQFLPADVADMAASIVALGEGLDGKLLALAGVVGAALQTMVTGLAGASLADRNAVVYADMAKALETMGETDLAAARDAAARGDMKALGRFWTKLSGMLIAEQGGWGDALQTAQLLTLDQINPISNGSD